MKVVASKTMYNKYFSEYTLSQNDADRLKKVQLIMLEDIHTVCEKYGLAYILCGGTLLGAVRHRGFIPWDDDVDIIMKRGDCMRLAGCVKKEFGEKYHVLTPYNTPLEPLQYFKIEYKGTEMAEVHQSKAFKHGIFLDVFPLDNVPDNRVLRFVKGNLYNFISKIPSVCSDYKYPSEVILKKAETEAELKEYYDFRRKLGRLFSFFSVRTWKRAADSLLICKNDRTKYCTVGCGTDGYFACMRERRIYFERIMLPFEKKMFFVPREYDGYLKQSFGEYMRMPPADQRENHIIIKLRLP